MIYTLTLNPALDRELTVPAIDFNTVLRASATRLDWGGKGFNVSRLLKNLGEASTAVGFLGGAAGRQLQNGLQALGIYTDFVWIAGETRTNVSVVTPTGGTYLKVNEAGPTITPEKQTELLDKVHSVAAPGDWWVLAGSLPPGVPADFYARLITLLNERGACSVLDTVGEPLRLGCAARPFLIKPNAEETEALTGLPTTTYAQLIQAAAQLQTLGACNIVISLGKAGAFLQTVEGAWLAHPPQIQEKNPIGAGDSLVGGLVWALAQKFELTTALMWGIASGAATASLSGTEVGSRSLIEELYTQARLERLPLATA